MFEGVGRAEVAEGGAAPSTLTYLTQWFRSSFQRKLAKVNLAGLVRLWPCVAVGDEGNCLRGTRRHDDPVAGRACSSSTH